MKKDYSLLRPFDLEAAKAGALLTKQGPVNSSAKSPFTLAAGPGTDGDCAVQDALGNIWVCHGDCLCMEPLAWVEGRPVYKGDVLHHSAVGNFIVEGVYSENEGRGCGPSLAAAGLVLALTVRYGIATDNRDNKTKKSDQHKHIIHDPALALPAGHRGLCLLQHR